MKFEIVEAFCQYMVDFTARDTFEEYYDLFEEQFLYQWLDYWYDILL